MSGRLNNKTFKITFFVLLGLAAGLCLWFFYPEKLELKKKENFNFNLLEGDQAPFTYDKTAPLEPDFKVDGNGVILYQDKYYHPGQLAVYGLFYLDTYRKTKDGRYLEKSQKHAQKLIEIAQISRGAVYFPYNFDFGLHGKKEDVMKAPWYSGMAQGQALSLFSRLYKETNDKKYLTYAKKTFKSFKNFKSEQPWTVMFDSEGYYWIEEYPFDPPTHVLNGFIFGAYGLYDYYMLTKDKTAKDLLEAALTTVKKELPNYRVEGGISYYCLKHKFQNKTYHQTHIEQLDLLYKMTGDGYFKTAADSFYNDFH